MQFTRLHYVPWKIQKRKYLLAAPVAIALLLLMGLMLPNAFRTVVLPICVLLALFSTFITYKLHANNDVRICRLILAGHLRGASSVIADSYVSPGDSETKNAIAAIQQASSESIVVAEDFLEANSSAGLSWPASIMLGVETTLMLLGAMLGGWGQNVLKKAVPAGCPAIWEVNWSRLQTRESGPFVLAAGVITLMVAANIMINRRVKAQEKAVIDCVNVDPKMAIEDILARDTEGAVRKTLLEQHNHASRVAAFPEALDVVAHITHRSTGTKMLGPGIEASKIIYFFASGLAAGLFLPPIFGIC